MTTWSAFADAAPELAATGRALLFRGGAGEALLATVRDDEPPRIHPINIGIVDGRLVAFLLRSAKRADLRQDGRYALHGHIDPAAPSEFLVRGRARIVTDPEARARAAAAWPFEVDEAYELFEFGVEQALVGARPTADDWPPAYTSWSAPPVSASRRSR